MAIFAPVTVLAPLKNRRFFSQFSAFGKYVLANYSGKIYSSFQARQLAPTTNHEALNMKTSVTFTDFCDAFRHMGRHNTYTYVGKRALFDYLEQYEEDCGTEIELDVIALCCEYSEYTSAADCIAECCYNYTRDEDHDDDEHEEACLDYLRDNTTVIEFDGGIIIQDF